MKLSFSIPHNGVLIPKIGDSVAFGDPLFTMHTAEFKIFNIAQTLSIQPENIFSYLSIVVGQQVSPGTLLAEKKSIIGKKRAQSDIEGIVERIQLDTGEIIISIGSVASSQTKNSWFHGTLHEVNEENHTFSVTFKDGHQTPLSSVSMDGGGELMKMDEKDFFTMGSDDIAHKIMLLENPQVHIVAKLDALDAAGAISTEPFPSADFPTATVSAKKDFDELLHSKKKHCAFSKIDLIAIDY